MPENLQPTGNDPPLLNRRPPRALWWSAGCVVLNLALNETIQKFGANWPVYVVVGLWILPIIPFGVYFFRREWMLRRLDLVRESFKTHPISYSICLILFLIVLGQSVVHGASLLLTKKQHSTVTQQQPGGSPQKMGGKSTAPPSVNTPPSQPSPNSKPDSKASVGINLEGKKANHLDGRLKVALPAGATQGTSSATSAPQPTGQSVGGVDCTGNNGNCAGINNGTQQTVYGAPLPPPHIVNLTSKPIAPFPGFDPNVIGQNDGPSSENPGVEISFQIDALFTYPVFIIACDRPCIYARTMSVDTESYLTFRQFGIKDRPNITGVIIGPGQMLKGTTIVMRIRSLDDKPISVVNVIGYAFPAN